MIYDISLYDMSLYERSFSTKKSRIFNNSYPLYFATKSCGKKIYTSCSLVHIADASLLLADLGL